MDFGFTNSIDKFNQVSKWREDAVKDGWSIKPTYNSEGIDRASTLDKDGFKAMIISRTNKQGSKWLYEAQVNVWGPDGLAIKPGEVYNLEQLKAGLRICNNCKKKDIDTTRYSFAGRCCKDCLPEMRKKHEYPGWCD